MQNHSKITKNNSRGIIFVIISCQRVHRIMSWGGRFTPKLGGGVSESIVLQSFSKFGRATPYPDLLFLAFSGKRQGKPPKKQGFSVSSEPLKSLQKEGKTLKKSKEFLEKQKSKEIQKSKERKIRVNSGMARVRLADLNGPKWVSSGQNGPKWTILVHFGLANAKIQFGIRPS